MSLSLNSRLVFGALFLIVGLICYYAIETAWYTSRLHKQLGIVHTSAINVSYILTPAGFAALGEVSPQFGVTSTGSVILKSRNRLVEIRSPSGGSIGELAIKESRLSSFSIDTEDNVVTVADGYLGALSSDGDCSKAVPLPYNDARVAHSTHKGAVYLFGGSPGDCRLYRFIDDGTYQVLLKSDEPIVGVTDTEDDVYVATATTVLRLRNEQPEVVFRVPTETTWGTITSIAGSFDSGGLLFVATDSKIYVLENGCAVSIASGIGGEIQLHNDVLFALDSRRQCIATLEPASERLLQFAR